MDSFDCIVIGSGHAGSCAALSAVEHGRQREEWAGGNGYFTAGAHRTVHRGLHDLVSIVKNPPSHEAIQRIDMEPYTRANFVGDIMRLGNGKSDPALVDALVDNSRDAIDWLAQYAEVPFSFSFNRQAYEVDGRQKFWGGMVLSVEDGGKGLIAAHRRALRKAGVQVWFDTPALSLVMSDDRISGVRARRDGHEIELRAPAVILAAGGFEANAELREKHLGTGWGQARVRGTPYNTGDGFALVETVGAKLTGDWAGCHSTAWDANAASDAGQRDLTNQYTKSGYPLGIMLNANGERFVDEGEDYRNYTYAKFGRAILNQPGGFAFQIWDSQVIDSLRKEEYGDGIVEKIFGSSMEELVDRLVGVGLNDKERALITLRDFNGAVHDHRDEHRDLRWDPAVKDGLSTQSSAKQLALPKSNWALALDTPPFMAVKVACGVTFTFGGLAIDPQSAAVLRKDSRVIDGLFCTGEMVGGLFFDNYPGGSGLTAGALSPRHSLPSSRPRARRARRSLRVMSLAGLVHNVAAAHRQVKPSTNVETDEDERNITDSPRPNGVEPPSSRSVMIHYETPPDTPSMRTGPPRSLSYAYSLASSPTRPKEYESPDLMSPDGTSEFPLSVPNDFKSALEYEQTDKEGKKRESRNLGESWGPIKWLQDSPKEERGNFDLGPHNGSAEQIPPNAEKQASEPKSPKMPNSHAKSSSAGESDSRPGLTHSSNKPSGLRRAFSGSHVSDSQDEKSGRARWSRIRSLIPNIINQDRDAIQSGPSAVTSHKVNITDELITGGLSTMMLRLWFERDEKDQRRIPILFHRLRIRVSDSLHPMHGSKSVFRIECEYANGAVRWVIYRQLRDFFSLHTHYTVSNVYNRNVDKLPEFPRTSLPYFKFLKKEGRDVGQADFARLQRESLENYLIELIRAVMFHPSTNRLAGFLEISALSISMARSGGSQYKAGFLEIAADGVGGTFGRKSAGWRAKKASRWCAIRESYLVVMEEPGQLDVWDVFLIDPDFEIERPKRYYRQGLHLLHADGLGSSHKPDKIPDRPETGQRTMIGSVTTKFSKLFHSDGKRRAASVNNTHQDGIGSEHASTSSSESVASQAPSAMLDPSTNINPLAGKNNEPAAEGKDHSEDVSKHTFYVTNAQVRLKLFARNESRWDTAQHVLVDDTEGTDQPEIWPGKDYSNPRMQDFHTLNKPEEDMYDRTKVPRMPWHDVAMQVVGQPARDLARHFVQRWNYLLRIKNHSRVMPFLLPPPEFKPGELHQLGLTGTCEMQICRSAGPWSMGTPAKIEHSIQNAYLKVNDVKVENKIGDAIVHRIIRAHRDGGQWKCCIVIPLLPGFTFPVDHSDASAPDDYLAVFSLRNWAKMRGDVLTTEQVYIHGKVCIVDDRLAIIGSANINERSQRGDRDSELAAVIRDTDMIDCTMAGKPFKVGRFAHTLRVRLMREHLGIDVDALDEEDLMVNDPVQPEYVENIWDPDTEQVYGRQDGVTHIKKSKQRTAVGALFRDSVDGASQATHATGEIVSKAATKALQKAGLGKKAAESAMSTDALEAERKTFTHMGQEVPGFTSSIVPTLEEKTVAEKQCSPVEIDTIEEEADCDTSGSEHDGTVKDSGDGQPRTNDGTLYGAPADASKSPQADDEPPHAHSGINDADKEEQAAVGARASIRRSLMTWKLLTPRPNVESDGFEDPISDAFWKNVWIASAVHNTEIYRKVFHAVPDDLITTWKQYKEFVLHHERLNKRPRDSTSQEPVARVPSETGDEGAHTEEKEDNAEAISDEGTRPSREGADDPSLSTFNGSATHSEKEAKSRRPARGSEPFEKWERDEMEKLLGQINGHLGNALSFR
ncbi:hypothetical protein DXG01_015191 [Tephrocybe rancida]|nr:hypothetical protein DXG01_015191 [Tephrocybe rancida]